MSDQKLGKLKKGDHIKNHDHEYEVVGHYNNGSVKARSIDGSGGMNYTPEELEQAGFKKK